MPRTPARAAAAAAMAWVAFAFRFQAPVFHNDHFEHLSMARQVLFGELPGRDFFDPGRPLTVLLSAAGQALFGHSLYGEALLTIGALSLGAAIVCWLASGLARSILAGIVAALLVIVISPRLYSYPKIIVFALVLLTVWWCAKRPSVGHSATLAAVTVFALLMRHDFGVYAGIVSLATLLMVYGNADSPAEATTDRVVRLRRAPWSPLASYVATGAMLVAPYLVWMQQNGLLASGATSGLASLAGAARVTPLPLHLDLSHGLVHLDPVRARVTVRWSAATTTDERDVLEQRYGLVHGVPEDVHTMSYGITDDSSSNLRALVADPHVDDTGGIDRGAGTIAVAGWKRWLSRLGVSRLVVGPFFDPTGAEAWIYYLFWLIPLAGLGVVGVRVAREGLSPETITVAVAALAGVILNLFLIRDSLDSRLPDVVVPPAIVGAWLLALLCRRVARAGRSWRIAALIVGTVSALVLAAALFTYSRTSIASVVRAATNVDGLRTSAAFLQRRPIDAWPADYGSIERLTRYVFECTTAADRLLLVAYEPGVFYYAERLFAGGIQHFHQRRFSSPPEQVRIVAALQRQHVPLVIVEDERFRMLQDDYVAVLNYINTKYAVAGETTFGTNRRWRIYANRAATPVRTWDGLPCFA